MAQSSCGKYLHSNQCLIPGPPSVIVPPVGSNSWTPPKQLFHIQSDVFGGNSGGPVLNKEGILLGIIARSDRHMNAVAIPARYIYQLLSESNVKHSGSRR